MAKILYNEGRVVGYSAYELFVRNLKINYPDITAPTEMEWLSSNIGLGSSMLLHITKDTVESEHYVDIQFPDNCKLVGANTILASFFDGTGTYTDSNPWCTNVTSYGRLINNTESSHPNWTTEETTEIPPANDSISTVSDTVVEQIRNYAKIEDGIIIQPGTWTATTTGTPYEDFSPTLSKHPRLRLLFSDMITTDFYILLTGFTYSGVVAGTTGTGSAVSTQNPENGDFLGPAAFPWSARVMFSVSPNIMKYMMDDMFGKIRSTTHNQNQLTIVNTEYMCLSQSDTSSNIIDEILGFRHLSGYMSSSFIDRYTINITTLKSYFYDSTATKHGTWMCNYDFDTFFSSCSHISESDQSNYVYCIFSNDIVQSTASQNRYYAVPIRKSDGYLSIVVPYTIQMYKDKDTLLTIDISAYTSSQATYVKTLLGSIDNVYTDHPTITSCLPYVAGYRYSFNDTITPALNGSCPAAPSAYSNDYVQWMQNIHAFPRNSTDTTAMLQLASCTANDIDYSYTKLSANEFIRYAATSYLNYPLAYSTESKSYRENTSYTFSQYIIGSGTELTLDSNLETILELVKYGGYTTSGSTITFKVPMTTNLLMTGTIASDKYFSPADISIYFITADDTTETGYRINYDITYTSAAPESRYWTTVNNEDGLYGRAVSTVDNFGTPLRTDGKYGTVQIDKLTWDKLIYILNHNLEIDIMGEDLRSLKTNLTNATTGNYNICKYQDGSVGLAQV